MKASEVAGYLDGYLQIDRIPDYPNALNGLQVEARGDVAKVAFAVDAAAATIDQAVRGGANLMIVHHGLFWDGNKPVVGRRYERLRALLKNDLAVYAAHLPLDVHAEVGNNAVLARSLGVEPDGTFGDYKGISVGLCGPLNLRREALAARLDELLGQRVRMVAGGPERIRRVGIVTGGGASYLSAAAEAGLDALITGEGAHHNFFDSTEGGINLYLGGHYATEVWGLRALAGHIQDRLGLECFFIDHPTGM